MTIASEISRLQGAKADIKTAIESKGVTVPSSTKLDSYDALIDSIQTGVPQADYTKVKNIASMPIYSISNSSSSVSMITREEYIDDYYMFVAASVISYRNSKFRTYYWAEYALQFIVYHPEIGYNVVTNFLSSDGRYRISPLQETGYKLYDYQDKLWFCGNTGDRSDTQSVWTTYGYINKSTLAQTWSYNEWTSGLPSGGTLSTKGHPSYVTGQSSSPNYQFIAYNLKYIGS